MNNQFNQTIDYSRTATIINLYEELKNCSAVGKQIGLSRQRIHAILKKQGIIKPKIQEETPPCPFCNSDRTAPYGRESYSGDKRYLCKNCFRIWRANRTYKKVPNPSEILRRKCEDKSQQS